MYFYKACAVENQQYVRTAENYFKKICQNIWQIDTKHLPLHSQSGNDCKTGLIR